MDSNFAIAKKKKLVKKKQAPAKKAVQVEKEDGTPTEADFKQAVKEFLEETVVTAEDMENFDKVAFFEKFDGSLSQSSLNGLFGYYKANFKPDEGEPTGQPDEDPHPDDVTLDGDANPEGEEAPNGIPVE